LQQDLFQLRTTYRYRIYQNMNRHRNIICLCNDISYCELKLDLVEKTLKDDSTWHCGRCYMLLLERKKFMNLKDDLEEGR
jgi:hypothetical protein